MADEPSSQHNLAEAINNFQKSLLIFGKVGDDYSQIVVLNSLGVALQLQGSFGEARDVFQHCYQLQENMDDIRGQALTLSSLGVVLQSQGKFLAEDVPRSQHQGKNSRQVYLTAVEWKGLLFHGL